MKKIFLYLAVGTLALGSCKKDDDEEVVDVEVDAATQNAYDDEAIVKFLDENYLDAKGNIKSFSDDDETDDNYTKLKDLPHETLASGVVYVVRPDAQPDPGKTITATDSLKIMVNAVTFKATKTDDGVAFRSSYPFVNSIASGNVQSAGKADSYYLNYFYVTDKILADYNEKYSTNYTKSYYEIEGFKEALLKFKSFEKEDSENYNLQGVIIVPSRAAFAKDAHYNYTGISFKDRSFIFNFQLYNAFTRKKL